jgi:hypothetical protein
VIVTVPSIASSLPSLAGTLPDLFRRSDAAGASADRAPVAGDPSLTDESGQRAPSPDETVRLQARRAALGLLTYERRSQPQADAASPIGMRGTHLDVRG